MHKSETDWMHARGQPASARAWPAASGQLARWRVQPRGTHPKLNMPPIDPIAACSGAASAQRFCANWLLALNVGDLGGCRCGGERAPPPTSRVSMALRPSQGTRGARIFLTLDASRHPHAPLHAVRTWPAPTSPSRLISLLGHTGALRGVGSRAACMKPVRRKTALPVCLRSVQHHQRHHHPHHLHQPPFGRRP